MQLTDSKQGIGLHQQNKILLTYKPVIPVQYLIIPVQHTFLFQANGTSLFSNVEQIDIQIETPEIRVSAQS